MWYVYFLFCEAGHELLYIGRSNRPKARLVDFMRRTDRGAYIGDLLQYENIHDACIAELQNIARYRPPFNKVLASTTGMLGHKHTAEAKQTIGGKNRGKIFTEAERKRISNALKGRAPTRGTTGMKMSEAAKQKLRGRFISAEARANMSAAQRKRQEREHAITCATHG